MGTAPKPVRLLARLALVVGLAAFLYLAVYRPLALRWGATDGEVTRALPGDESQPSPILAATRAVTIDASPETIWPWLMQMGHHRAGWYSNLDWVDNGGVPSAVQVIPELQQLSVGDSIPITARGDPLPFVPEVHLTVVAIEVNRYMLAVSPGGRDSWLWALEPIDAQHTRLLWRTRNGSYDVTSPTALGLLLAADLGDFTLARNRLLSIKERAEVRPVGSLSAGTPTLFFWTLAFAAFVYALAALVVRSDWLRPLLAIAVSYIVALALIFLMPPLWVDLLAVVFLGAGLWWLFHGPH